MTKGGFEKLWHIPGYLEGHLLVQGSTDAQGSLEALITTETRWPRQSCHCHLPAAGAQGTLATVKDKSCNLVLKHCFHIRVDLVMEGERSLPT